LRILRTGHVTPVGCLDHIPRHRPQAPEPALIDTRSLSQFIQPLLRSAGSLKRLGAACAAKVEFTLPLIQARHLSGEPLHQLQIFTSFLIR
jgi:hypothetical protein